MYILRLMASELRTTVIGCNERYVRGNFFYIFALKMYDISKITISFNILVVMCLGIRVTRFVGICWYAASGRWKA